MMVSLHFSSRRGARAAHKIGASARAMAQIPNFLVMREPEIYHKWRKSPMDFAFSTMSWRYCRPTATIAAVAHQPA
jgi:hypothetical protein